MASFSSDSFNKDVQPNDHQEIVSNFRKELFDEGILQEGDSIGTDDVTMERFLRARKYDLKKSKEMFRRCQEWRKTVEGVGIDELYRQMDPFDYPERKAVFDYWPMWFHKTDKQGRPLNFEFLGGLDVNRLYKECTPERHWQSIIVTAESLPREIIPSAARHHDKPVTSVFVIIDLKGFGISQFWQMKNLVQRSFQVSQDYYPETMGQLAILNAPSSFTFIWSAVKPWLDKETVKKIDVLGSDYQERLLELIDAENLPSILGGKCTCEEFGGCHLSGAGPWLDGRKGWGPNSKKADEKDTEPSAVVEESKSEKPETANGEIKSA
ncbi:CRAL/TRIO domain-containing protein [Dendrothele bispora CBS 962.96]|uniref:CRAL/TRIO domain-containing protein n=1 Tax=Dendrothele bispora (strain CBS 962.96) TaxID=1314807 RepID=A0A4S8MR61_DENBC|nr:CRAL/TRIO domain-containing protein [Dendrothele bispora CBS 962.96]